MNLIESNFIYTNNYDLSFIGQQGYDLWHGIYIQNSTNNIIRYNTVVDALGCGIHFWHEAIENNYVQYNFVTNHTYPQDTLLLRHNIIVSRDNATEPPVRKNVVTQNFINSDYTLISEKRENDGYISFSDEGLNNMVILESLDSNNTAEDNLEFIFNRDEHLAVDPLTSNLNMNIVGMLSGNFDANSQGDEIAIMFDLGDESSEIHIWKKVLIDNVYFLKHLGKRWQSNPGGFNANQLKGRLVAGDFNNDGRCDIAGLRDLGNDNSTIVLFTMEADGYFVPEGSGYVRWQSNPGAFNANQLTGRLVAGDFNNDGRCDIAGLRDLGNDNSTIVLFTMEADGYFAPEGYGYVRWQSNPGAFNANQLTGRLVAGDFNNDGRCDIAGLRDLGNDNSTIVLFTMEADGYFAPEGYSYVRWQSDQCSINADNIHFVVKGNFGNIQGLDFIAISQEQPTNAFHTIGWSGNDTVIEIQLMNNMKFIPWLMDDLNFNIPENLKSGKNSWANSYLKSISNVNLNLVIYPNPVHNNYFSILLPESGFLGISFYNQKGQLIYLKQPKFYESGLHTIYMNSIIDNGLYYIRLNYRNNIIMKKITIINDFYSK